MVRGRWSVKLWLEAFDLSEYSVDTLAVMLFCSPKFPRSIEVIASQLK
jgi:hypothetical protein